jgi:hypothetical protein
MRRRSVQSPVNQCRFLGFTISFQCQMCTHPHLDLRLTHVALSRWRAGHCAASCR